MPGALSRPTVTRHVAVALAALVCLPVLAPPAVAQDRGAKPSADELRNEYPLQASPQPTPEGAPSPASATSPAPRPRPAEGGGSGADARLVALVIVIAALAGGFAVGSLLPERRGARSGRFRPRLPASITTVLRPRGPVLSANRRDAAPQQERDPSVRPVPPAPDRAWTAEVEWHGGESSSRFCVVARTPDEADRTAVAESSPLEWPPTSPEAVQALTVAAERLETALIAAGWTPLPPGEPWYAKRFAWEPAPDRPEPPPAAAPPSAGLAKVRGRFQRGPAWPQETEALWRCEIRWDAGSSRFTTVVDRPGRRRGHVALKSRFTGGPAPDPAEHEAEVRSLAIALEAVGWERVGRGADWYSERFVWRGDGEPPDRLISSGGRRRDVSSA